jgi:hypothetical protein
VGRMSDEGTVEEVLKYTAEGKRSVGKLRK